MERVVIEKETTFQKDGQLKLDHIFSAISGGEDKSVLTVTA